MTSKFVHEDIVHYGHRVTAVEGESLAYFLCERDGLMNALYGGAQRDELPMYVLGVEVFHVIDVVDCMTCLVIKARRGECED